MYKDRESLIKAVEDAKSAYWRIISKNGKDVIQDVGDKDISAEMACFKLREALENLGDDYYILEHKLDSQPAAKKFTAQFRNKGNDTVAAIGNPNTNYNVGVYGKSIEQHIAEEINKATEKIKLENKIEVLERENTELKNKAKKEKKPSPIEIAIASLSPIFVKLLSEEQKTEQVKEVAGTQADTDTDALAQNIENFCINVKNAGFDLEEVFLKLSTLEESKLKQFIPILLNS